MACLPHPPTSAELRGPLRPTGCAAPKIHVDCNNLTALAIRNPRPVSCQTLAAGYVSVGAGQAGSRTAPRLWVPVPVDTGPAFTLLVPRGKWWPVGSCPASWGTEASVGAPGRQPSPVPLPSGGPKERGFRAWARETGQGWVGT